jgi:threonine/homoserine/homoserine lactone efflux protein
MDIYLTAGIVLGLSSGFSPGPLTTLVISQALQYGVKEGLKAALAPLITDIPIIVLSVFALTRLQNFQGILGLISIIGGVFLVYLAYLSFKTNTIDLDIKASKPRSLGKGTLVNFFSPNPYLFWISVGAPQVVGAWTQNPLKAAGFLVGFYVCLVGGKMSLAVIAARSRRLLSGKGYGYVMNILGGLLLVFAFILFWDGITFLKLWKP